MKNLLLIVISILSCLSSIAQETYSDYVLLNSGEKVVGNFARQGWFTGRALKLDDKRFKMNEVNEFQKDGIHYNNIENKYYAIRIKQGPINLYQPITSSNMTSVNTKKGTITYEIEKKHLRTFFLQKGDEQKALRLKPSVLYDMVKNNTKAKKMANLCIEKEKQGKKFSYIAWGLFGASIACLTTGVATAPGKASTPLALGGVVLLGGTATFGLMSRAVRFKNIENFKKTVDTYNKETKFNFEPSKNK